MQRLWSRTRDEQIAYHLADGRAPEFDQSHPHRIELARGLVDKAVGVGQEQTIVELGCGAGDISGLFSTSGVHRVHGFDVVPAAREACARRWPLMQFTLGPVEDVVPFECDVLVLCEFLEHVDDPIAIARDWLPKARQVVIGHPLNEPDPPLETGHIWSYTTDDWENWFAIGGHVRQERIIFPMGPWPDMVIGRGVRA